MLLVKYQFLIQDILIGRLNNYSNKFSNYGNEKQAKCETTVKEAF